MILEVLLTVLIVFLGTTFFGYWTHKWFHSPTSGRFYRAHLTHHFTLYPPERFLSEKYLSPGKDNTAFLFTLLGIPLIILPIILFAFHIIPLLIFVVSIISLAVFGFAHDILHDAFHIQHHWLRRFGWFLYLTNLHYNHHKNVQTNFGIYSFWCDKLFGSFNK